MKVNVLQNVEDALSAIVSRLLQADAEVAARLARLDGSVIEVCLRDTAVRAYAAPGASGVRLFRHHEGAVDVRVTGRLADFIAYARASRRGDSLGAGRIEISGDLAVAQNVQSLLADLRIDWDEILSRVVGDVPAHQLGRLARAAGAWTRAAASSLERDVTEYLHHESRLLPQRTELERLGRAIFTLADDADRFEARLRRLLQRGP